MFLRNRISMGLMGLVGLGLALCLRAAEPTSRVFVVLEGEPVVSGSGRSGAPAALPTDRIQRMAADQEALRGWVEGVGGRVLLTYSVLNHAAFVEVPTDTLAELGRQAGVVRVVAERHHARRLATSTTAVGATLVWRGTPAFTGQGIRIGIIDSGIDYLHAGLGGTGRVADFKANDPTRIETGTFPTVKVVGGVDLVGDDYDSASSGTATPRPDADPLDTAENGHGTHVAGIAAGGGVLLDGTPYDGSYGAGVETNAWRVAPGVAPQASLYGIKVFGRGGLTSSSIVVQALNRAADPNGDGDPSDHLDVVNLSLGTTYGEEDPSDPEISAVTRLAGLGCVVVLSAGNGGNAVFKIDSPAVAPAGIAVANSYDAGYSTGAVRVEEPGGTSGLIAAVEANFTPALIGLGEIRSRVVMTQPALACDAIQNAGALAGKIAMVDRGVCFFVDKVKALQAAGAIGVIVVNNVDGPPEGMAGIGDISTIRIPAMMISKAEGDRLKPLLTTGDGVTMTFSANTVFRFPELANTLAESSSRGPVWPSFRLKPDISAPGSAIDSVKSGSGIDPIAETGTSMSAPHVAGAAALLRQAHPAWSVADIKAALMNTALSPMLSTAGEPYPESRVGAGRLDVGQALQTSVVARSTSDPAAVSLSFGAILSSIPVMRTQTVSIVNLGSQAVTYRVVSSNTLAQPGVRLIPKVSEVTVPAGQTALLDVILEVDPERLVPDADRASERLALGRPRHGVPEASGQLWFLGGPVDLHVPWHCVPRALSERAPGAALAGVPAGDPVVMPVPSVGNAVHGRPLVGFFLRGYAGGSSGVSGDRAWTDIHAAGAASDFASAGSMAATRLWFAVVTTGGWPAPLRHRMDLDVEIDRDSNGSVDAVLSNGSTGGVQAKDLETTMLANDGFVTVLDSRNSSPLVATATWNSLDPAQEDPAAFLNGVVVHSATGAELGLTGTRTAFRYRAVTRGPFADQTPWIRFDASQGVVDGTPHGLSRGPWQVADGRARVTLRRSAAIGAGFTSNARIPLLCVYLHNASGNQARVVELDFSRADLDSDGLSDHLELQHLHDLAGTPTTDRDGDGQTEAAEILAGTDPLDARSVLRLGFATESGFPLEWSSVAGRRYSIWRSRTLAGPYAVWRQGLEATPPVNRLSDAELVSDAQPWFYRLGVE
jgi:subtilisin family serine protease